MKQINERSYYARRAQQERMRAAAAVNAAAEQAHTFMAERYEAYASGEVAVLARG